jgi:hypothetical protein
MGFMETSMTFKMLIKIIALSWRVDYTRWEPQEEGMMSTATSLLSVVKPRFIEPVGESQTS